MKLISIKFSSFSATSFLQGHLLFSLQFPVFLSACGICVSYDSNYAYCCILGCDAVQSGINTPKKEGQSYKASVYFY